MGRGSEPWKGGGRVRGEKERKGRQGGEMGRRARLGYLSRSPGSSCSSYATVESAEAIMYSKSAAAESDELQQLQ